MPAKRELFREFESHRLRQGSGLVRLSKRFAGKPSAPTPALFAGPMRGSACAALEACKPREISMTVEELQKATRALAMSIRDQIQQFEERAGGVYVDQVSLLHGDEMGLGKRTVDVNIDAKLRI